MKNEKIHFLINSMSGAERRHFYRTIRGGKDSKYAQLFNVIANQKVYDEASLIKKFGYADNHNNFAAAKKQLFKLVLKSLREFSSHFGDYQKILQLLKDIEILESRGLRVEALKTVKKAKELAVQNLWPVFQLLIEHWEQELSFYEYPNNYITPSLGNIIDCRLQYEALYKRIYRDNVFYSSFSYHQNPEHCYPEIVGHELMHGYSSLKCERSKWYFCLIKIECNRAVRNTAELSKWAKELLRIQQSLSANGFYKEQWELIGIFEYLHALLDNYEIDQFLKDFHLIEDLEYPAHRENLLRAKTRNLLVLQLYCFVISNKLEKSFTHLMEEVEQYINGIREENLHHNDVMMMIGTQYMYYSRREDDISVKWAALFDKYVKPKKYIKFYIVSKVMSLLSHYGLGNNLYIKNTLPTLERFIKKHNRFNSEFVFLFRTLNKLLNVYSKKEKESLLRDFKSDMKALQKTNRRNHLLSAYSLMVWADNCLTDKNLLDANRELFAPELS